MFTAAEESASWTHARAVLGVRVAGSPRKVALVRDAGLAEDAQILSRARAIVAESGGTCVEMPVVPTSDAGQPAALAALIDTFDVVVAIGGGAILDLVVIARAFQDARTRRTIMSPQRAGLVALPMDAPVRPQIIAVPTTIGTGAESSTVATCIVEDSRRLILGRSLCPDVAVFDPDATAGMPRDVYSSGLVEIMLRLAGPYITQGTSPAYSARVRLGLASALGELAQQPPSRSVREEVARIGALSHSPHLAYSTQTFGTRGWYVANELATTASVSKMTALIDVTPLIWERILDGDERWGERHRLLEFWRHAVPAPASDDPVLGFRDWTLSLGAAGLPDVVRERIDPVALADRCLRRWGYGLPMLGALRRDDLVSLFADLRNSAAPRASVAPNLAAVRQALGERLTTKGGEK